MSLLLLTMSACVDTVTKPTESPAPSDAISDDAVCEGLTHAAAGAAGPATCTDVGQVSWDLVVEARYDQYLLANPVGAPLSDGATPTLYVQGSDSDTSLGDAYGIDGASLTQVDHVQEVVDDANGTGLARDAFGRETWIAMETMADNERSDRLVFLQPGGGQVTESGLQAPMSYAPAVADVDTDGTPDFVLDDAAMAADGTEIGEWPNGAYGTCSTVADLDGDGSPEVVNSAGIWNIATGAGAVFDPPLDTLAGGSFHGALVQAGGELLVAGSNGTVVFLADTLGNVRWTWSFTRQSEEFDSPIAIGDLTGEGVPEIVADGTGGVYALDLGGHLLWNTDRHRSNWQSGGIALADLDADGAYEVITWGGGGLQILDGATGGELASMTDIGTSFVLNPPIVLDVDGDGSMEIVVTGGGGGPASMDQSTLYVIGPAQGRWARGRPVWNQLGYDITSIDDDGRIQPLPAPAWDTYQAWRAQPSHDGLHPDLKVAATDSCASSCETDGTVWLAVQVSNPGSEDSAGGTVSLHTWDGSAWSTVATTTFGAVPAGEALEGVLLEVPAGSWGQLQVVAVDGDSDECDFVNDRVTVVEDPCGGG